jgi:serine/threonine-protein kinase
MARVFEARRESLAGVNPRVAIKVILPDFADNRPFQELFVHEARIGSMLQHQNVVQIQDFDCQDGLYYLVMEYVDGITLRRVISLCRRHGVPVPLDVIAEIGRQICDGLAHAHGAEADDGAPLNLVHRDIKPSNLMLNPQGVVKLLDFGISKGWSRPEHKGAVRGTWGYMSPEQAEGENVTGAADLFGLAAVLYELATVQPLFTEKEPDVLKELLGQDEAARRAARLSRDYSGLSRVLVRALQRDPAARYESALAMGRALGALVQGPVSARDGLHRFQAHINALNTQTKVVRKASPARASKVDEDPASVTSDASEQGLPLSFGDVERPVRPVRRVEQGTAPAMQVDWGKVALPIYFVVAIGILLFTGSRLMNEGDGPASVVEAEGIEATRGIPAAPEPVVEPEPEPAVEPEPEPVAVAPAPAKVAVNRPGQGRITISSIPRAQVYVDGKLIKSTPLFKHDVPAGARSIELKTNDGKTHSFKLDVRNGADIHKVWSFSEGKFVGK